MRNYTQIPEPPRTAGTVTNPIVAPPAAVTVHPDGVSVSQIPVLSTLDGEPVVSMGSLGPQYGTLKLAGRR